MTYRDYQIEYEPARGFPVIKNGKEVHLAVSGEAALDWIDTIKKLEESKGN